MSTPPALDIPLINAVIINASDLVKTVDKAYGQGYNKGVLVGIGATVAFNIAYKVATSNVKKNYPGWLDRLMFGGPKGN